MKIANTQDLPYYRLSSHQELILFLIHKELLSTKFTNKLCEIGFDDTSFNLNLGSAILSLVGFRKRTDDLWQWYYNILDEYSEKVDLKNTAETGELALDFYVKLRQKFLAET